MKMERPVYHLEGVLEAQTDAPRDFVGPLDLILHLLSRNQVAIRDIAISQILEQYVDWVHRRQELDLEVASEFITMAAHLLYIKSRMLLSQKDEEALSEMEELMRSLEERQRCDQWHSLQEAIPILAQRYAQWGGLAERPPETLPEEETIPYGHLPDELARAMGRIHRRNGRKTLPDPAALRRYVHREPYPVEKKSREIQDFLARRGRMRLEELWASSQSRSELVAVFLAVLELCRLGKFHLIEEANGVIIAASSLREGKNTNREKGEAQ